jgi:hypothetical protein
VTDSACAISHNFACIIADTITIIDAIIDNDLFIFTRQFILDTRNSRVNYHLPHMNSSFTVSPAYGNKSKSRNGRKYCGLLDNSQFSENFQRVSL